MQDRTCSIEGCGRPVKARGWCFMHYTRWHQKGDPGQAEPMRRFNFGAPCEVEGCTRPARTKGMCPMHYERVLATGDAGAADPQRRPNGSGSYDKGYLYVGVNGGRILAHRHVMEQHLGRKLVKGENVHHINGVRDDNRLENLELWNTTQPSGQRVEDKIAWAKDLLRLYEPDALR
jgi:hypothetical protein